MDDGPLHWPDDADEDEPGGDDAAEYEPGDDDVDEDLEPYVYDATVAPGDATMATLLARGRVEVLGMMPWSSNGTFLVEVRDGDRHAPAVYKPEAGERPLWDFPCGLWRREVAAHVLSEAMGFDLVPPTVARDDAPMGPGSLQAFVPARFAEHYFTLRDLPAHAGPLRRLCAFDLVANSADRKGGHCLVDDDDRLWAIDNGLSFHVEPKVRTVIWDFAGEPLPASVAEALARLLDDGPPAALDGLVTPEERDAVMARARAFLADGRFPHDPTGRRWPWPMV